MKNKTLIKYLIWITLGAITLYFVAARNGALVFEGGIAQLITTTYAVVAAIVWGFHRNVVKRRSVTYLSAILLYASVLSMMVITRYIFSPTQMVAVIALFYYSSKIISYTFPKK